MKRKRPQKGKGQGDPGKPLTEDVPQERPPIGEGQGDAGGSDFVILEDLRPQVQTGPGDSVGVLNPGEIIHELDVIARSITDYRLAKDAYLVLCRRYRLNPFDLYILDHRLDRIPHRDKVQLVRLILRLTRIERSLRGSIGERLLFPLTVEQSERTGYLVPPKVSAIER